MTEPTRVVTIRLPLSVYEALVVRAKGRKVGSYLREQLSNAVKSDG